MTAMMMARAGARPAASGAPTLSYTTNLVLRLDASVTASMTDAGSGACSAWADQSGNSNNAAQATSGKRPTIGTDTTTGLGKLTFDGTDDNMTVAHHSTLMPSTGVAVFVACNISSWGAGYPGLITKATAATGTDGYRISKSGSPVYAFANDSAASYGTAPTGRKILTLHYDSASATGDTLLARLNGSAAGASSTYNSTIVANSLALVLGSAQATSSATNYVGVDLFEVLVYSAGIAASDRNAVETYLATKWMIP